MGAVERNLQLQWIMDADVENLDAYLSNGEQKPDEYLTLAKERAVEWITNADLANLDAYLSNGGLKPDEHLKLGKDRVSEILEGADYELEDLQDYVNGSVTSTHGSDIAQNRISEILRLRARDALWQSLEPLAQQLETGPGTDGAEEEFRTLLLEADLVMLDDLLKKYNSTSVWIPATERFDTLVVTTNDIKDLNNYRTRGGMNLEKYFTWRAGEYSFKSTYPYDKYIGGGLVTVEKFNSSQAPYLEIIQNYVRASPGSGHFFNLLEPYTGVTPEQYAIRHANYSQVLSRLKDLGTHRRLSSRDRAAHKRMRQLLDLIEGKRIE